MISRIYDNQETAPKNINFGSLAAYSWESCLEGNQGPADQLVTTAPHLLRGAVVIDYKQRISLERPYIL